MSHCTRDASVFEVEVITKDPLPGVARRRPWFTKVLLVRKTKELDVQAAVVTVAAPDASVAVPI